MKNEPIEDEVLCLERMALIEQYEDFLHVAYEFAKNIKREHHVVKDMFTNLLMRQVELFNDAGKTGQISRIYLADAGIASLRFYLRFLSKKKLISRDGAIGASVKLTKCGKMVNAWIRKVKAENEKEKTRRENGKAALTTTPGTPVPAT